MSSPAKRRKTNSSASTPSKSTGSLDFFFGKQREQNITAIPGGGSQSSSFDAIKEEEKGADTDEQLTDEQLARKLQEQWDREDQALADGSAESADAQPQASQDQTNHAASNESKPESDDPHTKESSKPKTSNGLFGATQQPKTLSLQSATADEDTISTTIPFDQSPLTFDPQEYIPQLKEVWASEGGRVTYALLTRCFVLVNSTQSRIKIVDNLVNMLRVIIEGDPESLLPAVWLATNSIAPPYIDLELGLGGSAISKALKMVCGLDDSGLRTLYKKYGDAGDVAFEAKKRQSLTLRKPKPLTIKGVYESLVKIANSKGQGSQETKQRIVERLLQGTRGAEESRYVVRTLVQHLRIGAVKTTMLIALSRAFFLSRPPGTDFEIRDRQQLAKLKKEALAEVWSRGEEIIKACFARRPNYNDLVPAMLQIGVCDELLIRCGLALHIPLRPMLGNITRDLGDMLTKLQGRAFSCEYKYDGQRAQVHCDNKGKVTIFSRHLEVMTEKYPDLVALVPTIRGEGVSSFIMEGEVVAVDRDTGDLKTFQTLSNRARKDVVIGSVKIDVCLFAFDLMYLNGEELLNRPFRERRELLRSLFTEVPNRFTWVKNLDATSAESEAVLEFFNGAVEIKCEGIMVKILDNLPQQDLENASLEQNGDEDTSAKPLQTSTKPKPKGRKSTKASAAEPTDDKEQIPDVETEKEKEKDKGGRRKALLATYEPDKRIDSWLKVKKDYNTSTDTLDLIPIAAWHGMGRKAKWWSPILLAVRNPETGCLEAVTKCISGFTDKFYIANKEKYAQGSDNVISKPSYVEYEGFPDVWFQPQEVWEMVFADITLSPTYTAGIGLVSEDRGMSLRFPRFLKVREDKSIDEASTADFLASLYRKQEAKAPNAGAANDEGGVDDDYEF